MTDITLEYDPQPRQRLLHETPAKQVFYGGAAGGGKSHSLRWDAIVLCLENPGLDAYLFRRTLPELEANHIRKIRSELPPELGHYNETRKRYEFFNGSGINFCYCEREADVTRYQGAEMHWLGVDEASHLTEFQLTYLRGRVRLGSFVPKQKHILPRIVFASNPGGVGHSFLKQTFINPAPAEEYFYDSTMKNPHNPEDHGWLTVYIPAKIRDNKYLDINYAGQFQALAPELARALADGDWDAVVGAALHNLTRDRHQLRPFKVPRHWTKFMAMDWGTAAPFSVGWYAISEGVELAKKGNWPARWLPEGAIIRYDEIYGWNGRANQGCRMAAQAVGKKVIHAEKAREDVMDYRIADTQMWAQSDGPSAAENFMKADPRLVLRKAEKDRKANYAEFVSRLAGSETYTEHGVEEADPMFFCTANCVHFWRTVPILTLDETDPDKGWAQNLENHVADEVAYALRSRPYVSTKETRYEEEYGEEMRAARGQIVDPYATA